MISLAVFQIFLIVALVGFLIAIAVGNWMTRGGW